MAWFRRQRSPISSTDDILSCVTWPVRADLLCSVRLVVRRFFYTPSLTKVFGCVIWILNTGSQFNSSLTNLFHKSARLFCHHLFQTACTGASFQGGWHHCHRHRRHHHHHISVAANILALIKRESYINVDTRCVIEMFLGRRESRFALKVASKSARYQLRQKPLKFSAHICS